MECSNQIISGNEVIIAGSLQLLMLIFIMIIMIIDLKNHRD
jgi:hypothetical protein